MWYFEFETPEEFFKYQDTQIKNWGLMRGQAAQMISYLYRSTGRTTCELKCISTLLSQGKKVQYVIYNVHNNSKLLKYFEDQNLDTKNLEIIEFTKYKESLGKLSSYVEERCVVFDHHVFEVMR